METRVLEADNLIVILSTITNGFDVTKQTHSQNVQRFAVTTYCLCQQVVGLRVRAVSSLDCGKSGLCL